MFFKNISKKFSKLIKLLLNASTRKGLYYNIAASVELEELVKDLEVDTIIDVGSNKGQFILIIDKFFKNTKVLSFEPISELLEIQKNFFVNRKNIRFFNFGVGSINSKIILNITRQKDSSSILEIEKKDKLGKKFDIIEKRQIDIKKLEDVVNSEKLNGSVLLKLDVQGYELEVLKGAVNILPKIKYIITEVAENQFYKNQVTENVIIKYLNDKNFKIMKFTNIFKIENTNYIQKDVLLVNKLNIKND
jgi:FkbM family methyltransferase